MECVLPFQTNKGFDHILAKYNELPRDAKVELRGLEESCAQGMWSL